MFRQPSFLSCYNGCNAECQALFAQKSVPSIARPIGPYSFLFREMGNILLSQGGARPVAAVKPALGGTEADPETIAEENAS